MYQVSCTKEKLIRMFDQIRSEYVKGCLTSYLMEVINKCGNKRAGVVAETLLNGIKKYSYLRCSEKQALAVAYRAYEHNIIL